MEKSFAISTNTIEEHITYVSREVDLSIYYEKYTFEIYLAFHHKETDIHCYLDEIVRDIHQRKYLFGCNKISIKNAINEIKFLVLQYCEPFIRGDICAFSRVMSHRNIVNREYEVQLIEYKAKNEWNAGNYNTVARLYESINEELTPIQKKRYDISVKKMIPY